METIYAPSRYYGGNIGPMLKRYCLASNQHQLQLLLMTLKPDGPHQYACRLYTASMDMPVRQCVCWGDKCNRQNLGQHFLAPVAKDTDALHPNGTGNWSDIFKQEQYENQPRPTMPPTWTSKPGPVGGGGGASNGVQDGSNKVPGNSDNETRICDPRYPDEADCAADAARGRNSALSITRSSAFVPVFLVTLKWRIRYTKSLLGAD
ncbi:uncharacterized protein LOC129595454 isoform X2 [Paramacrobiotus metropolitanus]|nr:uncharacterized protein LOC129595454 isoform X2 [Paramacrobiotus metropolitanus]